jgi:hypothetical protein
MTSADALSSLEVVHIIYRRMLRGRVRGSRRVHEPLGLTGTSAGRPRVKALLMFAKISRILREIPLWTVLNV